jgi:hypothetical protein
MTTETCNWKMVKSCTDMEHGHVEYDTVTECGEDIDCFGECYKNFYFCPYCGKPFPEPSDIPTCSGCTGVTLKHSCGKKDDFLDTQIGEE